MCRLFVFKLFLNFFGTISPNLLKDYRIFEGEIVFESFIKKLNVRAKFELKKIYLKLTAN
jgi:hypothetical protein